jgi:hypothetical protein
VYTFVAWGLVFLQRQCVYRRLVVEVVGDGFLLFESG